MKEIEDMRNSFYMAYSGISFSPEVRADTCVKDFSEELEEDMKSLSSLGSYKEKYLEYLKTWISRKSRCMSPMITGSANFPVRSNLKHINSEQRAWEEFRAWRKRYIQRANAVKIKSPEEDLDDALAEFDKAQFQHNQMLEINKILRKKISDDEQRLLLIDLGLKPETINNLMAPDIIYGYGIPTFTLTNSRTKIKRLAEKIMTMKARINRKETFKPIDFPDGNICIESDRVIIKHDKKPSIEIINKLKHSGFHWSSRYTSWSRKHTANALKSAIDICIKSNDTKE